jgi:ketol-acid reductoisomerase
MKQLYFDDDADLDLLESKTVAMVGFGTQGMAQGLNIRDSGLEVIVGEEPDSAPWKRAADEGFEVMSISEVAGRADIYNLQIPDMAFRQADAYNQMLRDKNKPGDLVCLSSAYNYYYDHIDPPPGVDAIVAAPKSPGSAVRQEYVQGRGVPGLLAIHRDASGQAHALGLALCKALGFTRVGVQDTTVEEELVTDLMGEHCAWGAIVSLLRAVFEVIVEAGYDPNIAFYEAINESKLTTDLIHRYGLAGMLERISNTAAFGAITIGPMIVDDYVKDRIRWAMENIKNGGFNEDWQQDYQNNYVKFRAMLDELRNSQADQIGNQIRQHLGVMEKGALTATNW